MSGPGNKISDHRDRAANKNVEPPRCCNRIHKVTKRYEICNQCCCAFRTFKFHSITMLTLCFDWIHTRTWWLKIYFITLAVTLSPNERQDIRIDTNAWFAFSDLEHLRCNIIHNWKGYQNSLRMIIRKSTSRNSLPLCQECARLEFPRTFKLLPQPNLWPELNWNPSKWWANQV